MVTARFGLDELTDALNADLRPGNIKAVVYPGISEWRAADQQTGEARR
jgi:L-iditol 2-dehydrogenase